MTTGSLGYQTYFSPSREAKNSIKSDSLSGAGGSQVVERDGQSSKTTIDTAFFHGKFAQCAFIQQQDSILQRESNNPIEEIFVNVETLMAKTMKNMRLKKERKSFCGYSSIHGDTIGLPDSIPPLPKSLGSELQAGYNISLVDFQSRQKVLLFVENSVASAK